MKEKVLTFRQAARMAKADVYGGTTEKKFEADIIGSGVRETFMASSLNEVVARCRAHHAMGKGVRAYMHDSNKTYLIADYTVLTPTTRSYENE